MGIRKKRKNVIKMLFLKCIVLLFLIITITLSVLMIIDKKITPYALLLADNYIKGELNYKISETITEIIVKYDVKTDDLYRVIYDSDNNVKSIETNTILINKICAEIAKKLSVSLLTSDIQVIEVPLGTILNIELLSNYGPKYKIVVKPVGIVDVEYETSFESVGLNQSNYRLDLIIDSKIQLANPFREETIDVVREVTLINNVINGEVPNGVILPTYN